MTDYTVRTAPITPLGWTLSLIAAERMKNGKPHIVPLPPRALALIREALALRCTIDATEPLKSAAIFPARYDGYKEISSNFVSKLFGQVAKSVGIADVTLHDLRRTGSTNLTSERLRVSPFIRSKVLGHTDAGGGAAVSAVHYDVNPYLSEKRRALEAWEDLLLEIVGERTRMRIPTMPPCHSEIMPPVIPG